MSENSLEKFKELLRILFQFDCVDLDFGIYRILNYKRSQVEAFITQRLPQIVDEAFARYAAADKAVVEQELEQTRQEIVNNLGEQAIDESGQLRNYHRTRLGRQYLLLMERRARYEVADELKTRIYNDLFTFFSRYYEDGDFISKRRYGRHETYAIPYDGEEVTLYWANRDQYYVKTGDRFKAYRFKVGDYSVSFELRNVAPEQNGNGGKKRYFVLAQDAPVIWNEQEKALAVAFEYRPLTEAEEGEHGRTGQQKPQDSLNEAAERKILELVADGNLKVALAKPEGTNGSSLLHKHLTRFSRRNTADFFIHKDLRGFLRRELDLFIKNGVLLLDELIAGGEEDLREHVQRGRVVRQVAEAIIDFLAQVEDFQKRLWEKRKFVLHTEYCLTIDRVPEELWDEVLANEAQVAEWRQLYALDELLKTQGMLNTGLNRDFLETHPTLVVDTRHFPEDFKWRLLTHFEDLDEALDGVLIKSENWQALNLLLGKYREKVKCIYIDPPFNTGDSEILYKNNYLFSSWLTLMENRLAMSMQLLSDDPVLFIAIDDFEMVDLCEMLDKRFPLLRREMIIVNHHPQGGKGKTLASTHEYMLTCVARSSDRTLIGRMTQDGIELRPFKRSGTAESNFRYARPNSFYAILVDAMTKEVVGIESPPEIGREYPTGPTDKGFVRVYPVGTQDQERVWRRSYESCLALVRNKKLQCSDNMTIYQLIEAGDRTPALFSNWVAPRYNAGTFGANLLGDIMGWHNPFSYPKSIHTVEDAIFAAQVEDDALCLDYFAGSGTTAHAVINLNRQDMGRRKYVMVEIGDWFETVMLPRIKKVVFCEKWKDGKPQGGPGISHMLRYQYLEQYEDTLNNLELPRAAEGQLVFEKFGDEYMLKYMLDFETQGSPSLLNLDRFKDPFAYKLKVLEGDEIVERPVDLVETFNYLLGIQIKKLKTFKDGERLYRAVLGEKGGRLVAIVWRSVVGLEDNEKALMNDKAFIEKSVLPALLGEAKPERLLVNGACLVKDAEAIEPEFKWLMFAPVGV